MLKKNSFFNKKNTCDNWQKPTKFSMYFWHLRICQNLLEITSLYKQGKMRYTKGQFLLFKIFQFFPNLSLWTSLNASATCPKTISTACKNCPLLTVAKSYVSFCTFYCLFRASYFFLGFFSPLFSSAVLFLFISSILCHTNCSSSQFFVSPVNSVMMSFNN